MERLGKYEIRSTLGRGAMGTVYEGWDPVISRRVAIKTVRLPDSDDSEEREMLGRFKQEAQAAGRLQHPNIVGVFDYAETDELAYIVMEFVSGTTLKAIIETVPRPDVTEAARLMDGLLTGLGYSHGNGVIHRDIKPANVMVTPAGQVKIADFGIARIESSTMTQAGMIMGTPAFMSPEQFQGVGIDSRTDLYSAGVVLFQLLTGKRPFEGNMATIMHAVLNNPTPRPSDVDAQVTPALDAVVARAMARDADDRYPTATDFNRALQAALTAPEGALPRRDDPLGDPLGDDATVIRTPVRPARGDAVPAPRPSPATPARTTDAPAGPGKSKLPMVLAGVGALVLLGGGGAFWALSGGPAPASAPTASRVPPPGAALAARDPAGTPAPTPTPAIIATQDTAPARPPDIDTAVAPTPVSEVPAQSTPPFTQMPPARSAEPAPVATAPVATAPVATAPVAVAFAAPSADAVRHAVAASLRAAPCTFATGDDRPQRTPALQGVAGRGAGEAALRDAMAEAAPGVAFDWQVTPVDGPYCAVLDVLRPFARPYASTARTLSVTMFGGRNDLVAKDLVRPRVALADGPANLQLDYIASDGSVLHMQNSKPGAPYPADATPAFGEPRPGFKGWEIDEPFGTDLIVAISSSVPLLRAGQTLPDTLDGYVRDLHAALDQAARSGARVSAFVLPIRTAPRR